jgi:glycosyltransferase involved in cell wall biosynthesis
MRKVVLIQNIIAPYRVGLFEALARIPGVKLLVVQLTRSEPHRKEWERTQGAFERKVLKGFRYSRSYDEHTMINPSLPFLLLRCKPRVVIISGFSPASLFIVLLKRLANYKVILWSEGTRVTEGSIGRTRLRLRKRIAMSVDATIVPGRLAKEYVRELNIGFDERTIFVAFNSIDGIETNMASTATDRVMHDALTNDRFDYLLQTPNILCVARLIASKGIWELIRAFEMVKPRVPAARLLLAGTGTLEAPLRAYCCERSIHDVEFLGFLSPAELEQVYRKTAVFVLLSHIDRNPLVIVEALRAGLPIIASHKIGNVPECVLHEMNGYVVDPEATQELAAHIERLLINVDLRDQFAAHSKMLSEKFSHQLSAEVFHRAIQFVN